MSESETNNSAPWICPTCDISVSDSYCARCGEQRLGKRELSLAGLGAQAVESVANVDGRVFRSLRALLLRPGELTAAYLRGQRKPYVGPVQLFLVANVLFFVLQTALGFHALSNPLDSHLEDQVYSEWATTLAERRFESKGVTREAYAPLFDRAVAVNAKLLAVVLVPMFALLVSLLFLRSRRRAVAHLVFGLHFVAFLLLSLCAMPLVAIPLVVALDLLGASERIADPIVTWILLPLCGVYAFHAFGRVYGGGMTSRALRSVVLAAALIPLIRVYRLLVFLVTLYTT
jgi:hypothetical protein